MALSLDFDSTQDSSAIVSHMQDNINKIVAHLNDVTKILQAPFNAGTHGDLSASVAKLHSATSIFFADTADKYTATNVETALAEIAQGLGYDKDADQAAVSQMTISASGITYDGRVTLFAQADPYVPGSGGAVPAKPTEYPTLAEVRHVKATRDFLALPFIVCMPLYNPGRLGTGSLTADHVHRSGCFAHSISLTGCTFRCYSHDIQAIEVPGWLYWIAFGNLNLA